MRSIALFSTAVAPMSAEALAALGEERAEIDGHVGITGMLLHKQGDFLQVIEGRDSVIRDMFFRISTDPRHKGVRKISERDIRQREFDGQMLPFKNLDVLPQGAPFLNPFSYDAFAAEPELAMLALAFFFRNPRATLGWPSSE
jgi:hypothetical protein